MSYIADILGKLEGTSEFQVLTDIEKAYEKIEAEQEIWFRKSAFLCPAGCGECCIHFEPDLMPSEAAYMGAWLLENQRDVALAVADGVFPFPSDDHCQFYNPDSIYHCSIYKGRCFICRLFGASSSRSKMGKSVFKPCKFYPDELLVKHNPPLEHRQYSEEEIIKIFGIIPPEMQNLMDGTASDTTLIRDILPRVIRHLLFIIEMNGAK